MQVKALQRETEAAAPSRGEFVARAEALLPAIRARADATERNRRLPDETVAELLAADFHRILQPARFGGYGLTLDVAADVVRTIASGCGSSGWVTNLFILHNWQVSLFGQEAQEEYFGTAKDVLASTASFAPNSKFEPADGGFRISGRWKFSSGCDFAHWFIIMKPSTTCFDWALVPRADVTIADDWFVSGLCGTGSKDIILDNVFVPKHRVLDVMQVMTGTAPGAQVTGSPYARIPFPLPAVWGIPPAIIGMVEGMADAVQKSLVGKRALFSGEAQIERVANQMKLAEAHADINAAKLVMKNRLEKVLEWGEAGAPPGGAEAYSSKLDAAYVARLMAKTANSLSIAAGATSIYLSNPVQRFARDVSAAATHVSLVWEESAEDYGRAAWNLPPKMPGA